MPQNTRVSKTILTITALALPVVFSLSQPALAIKGDRERSSICQQLRADNELKWVGVASGVEDSTHAIFEHSRSFHTRACFRNKKACDTWIKRIWWEIPTMEELRTAYCKPA